MNACNSCDDRHAFQKEADRHAKSRVDSMRDDLKALDSDDEATADEAREHIQEGPLEVKTSTDWNGTRQYMILLGTGGPADRIIGDLSEYGEPETAEYQFQDWYKPWTTAYLKEDDAGILLHYASQFYFEELEA